MSDLVILKWDEAPHDIRDAWYAVASKRMSDVHENRKKEWALARTALAICLSHHQITLDPHHTVFKNHHEMTHLPHWRFSLSHTKDRASAWLLPKNECRGMGVDIELKNRPVPANVKTRLSHPADEISDPLTLWSLKEAAYKALPSLAQENIWLNRIIIRQNQFELADSPFQGTWKQEHSGDLIVSYALLPN